MKPAPSWVPLCGVLCACASTAPREPTIVVVVNQPASGKVDRQAVEAAASAAAARSEKEERQARRSERKNGTSITIGSGLIRAHADGGAGDAGIAWTARLTVGTRDRFGFESAYLGSWRPLFGQVGSAGSLVQNGFEGVFRLNLGEGGFQPYAVAGAGWARYSVLNGVEEGMKSASDDVVTMPLGVGVSVYFGRRWDVASTIDFRLVHQLTFGEDLPEELRVGQLDQWIATLQAGWEL
jgi:hypothetical protein